MASNRITLQEPLRQEQPHPALSPDIFVAFSAPASQEWIDCCLGRFSSRVSKHFQISELGFSIRQVAPEQVGSEMANLRQLVREVNSAFEQPQAELQVLPT
jgi:hypothetical protein